MSHTKAPPCINDDIDFDYDPDEFTLTHWKDKYAEVIKDRDHLRTVLDGVRGFCEDKINQVDKIGNYDVGYSHALTDVLNKLNELDKGDG